jgi:hypothetical protein
MIDFWKLWVFYGYGGNLRMDNYSDRFNEWRSWLSCIQIDRIIKLLWQMLKRGKGNNRNIKVYKITELSRLALKIVVMTREQGIEKRF